MGPLPYADMPSGPAHTWGAPGFVMGADRVVAFLGLLERLEETIGQIVEVALPDLVDEGLPATDSAFLYDRLRRVAGEAQKAAAACGSLF